GVGFLSMTSIKEQSPGQSQGFVSSLKAKLSLAFLHSGCGFSARLAVKMCGSRRCYDMEVVVLPSWSPE
ncbi:hypothetical protein, partial [Caballeronia ptereochthonis]|uniref:hypothetical protein n=1 Tax=Caballeronia ptereochthonis TaxID=1777144 RepID=UPI001ABF4EEA